MQRLKRNLRLLTHLILLFFLARNFICLLSTIMFLFHKRRKNVLTILILLFFCHRVVLHLCQISRTLLHRTLAHLSHDFLIWKILGWGCTLERNVQSCIHDITLSFHSNYWWALFFMCFTLWTLLRISFCWRFGRALVFLFLQHNFNPLFICQNLEIMRFHKPLFHLILLFFNLIWYEISEASASIVRPYGVHCRDAKLFL